MAVDILIIRNKCDAATAGTHLIGQGLKAHLTAKGRTVTDLSDADTTPEKVTYWLNTNDHRTKKLIIALDHGGLNNFYGEKNNQVTSVISKNNVESLTKGLHVYTFACSTNGNNGIGQESIAKGCFSWLGYTEPVYVFTGPGSLMDQLRSCIWSYIDAVVAGKTLEQAEAALKKAYKDRFSKNWLFKYNHDRLLLRKKQNGLTIDKNNRVVKWERNKKITALYAYGPQDNNIHIHFQGLGWKKVWPNQQSQAVSLMAAAAHAKAKNRRVDFFEDDGKIKQLYVF